MLEFESKGGGLWIREAERNDDEEGEGGEGKRIAYSSTWMTDMFH